jgi:hypothetical protein
MSASMLSILASDIAEVKAAAEFVAWAQTLSDDICCFNKKMKFYSNLLPFSTHWCSV